MEIQAGCQRKKFVSWHDLKACPSSTQHSHICTPSHSCPPPPPTHTYVRTLCFSAFCPAWWRAAIIQMTSETGGGTLVAYAYFFSGEWTGAAVDFQPLLARPCQCRCTVGCWLGEGRGGGRAHQCKKLTYKLTTACLDALCLFALGCGNWMSRQPV